MGLTPRDSGLDTRQPNSTIPSLHRAEIGLTLFKLPIVRDTDKRTEVSPVGVECAKATIVLSQSFLSAAVLHSTKMILGPPNNEPVVHYHHFEMRPLGMPWESSTLSTGKTSG